MQSSVGRITVCYGTHLWSLVLWARVYHCDCIILAFHSTYETQQRLVKLGGLTLGISKVFQISSYSSHKIQLILAILTVLYTFLYLLWGTRTGNCRVFVYLLFLGNPLGELGHIIHRWKGMSEEIAAPLES